MDPQALKATLGSELLSFPVTDFDAAGDFRPEGYAASASATTCGRCSAIAPTGS